MVDLMFKEAVFKIVGAAMQVYNQMGHRYLEAVYHECIEVECEISNIPVVCQAQLALTYKNRRLKKHYVADALCLGEVVVEFKAGAEVTKTDLAQLINYVKASGKRVGVLIFFGHHNELKWQRVAV